MNSLEKLCLFSVARNASNYGISDFEALNVYVLQQLVSYLGAYQLNRLHNIFIEMGIDTERVWKRHLASHYTATFVFPMKIFNSDCFRRSGTEARRMYLERLFKNIMSNLDLWTDEPVYVTNLRRLPKCCHGVCFQCLDSTALDNSILQDELPLYAEHAQILSIMATSPTLQYLLNHHEILKILQRTVHRLHVHTINIDNFSATRELVWLLVQEGYVSEISIFGVHLPCELLEDLMMLVSGQCDDPIPSSLSDPVEHPIVETEPSRMSEDVGCVSTQWREQGGLQFSGCELVNAHMTPIVDRSENVDVEHWAVDVEHWAVDVQHKAVDEHRNFDIPDTMVGVDVGKNVDNPLAVEDEIDNSTADVSVANQISSLDDDLYDLALTTSSSIRNPSKPSLRSLVPGNSGTITIETNRQNTSSSYKCSIPISHLRDSRSGCEHSGRAVFNSETSSCFHSVLPPRSCTAFALGLCRETQLQSVLLRVLRNWTSLQKLALLDVVDVDEKSQQEGREDFQGIVCRLIESNQLTHFVSYHSYVGLNIANAIASALMAKQSDRPLEEFKILIDSEPNLIRYPQLTNPTGTFFGTACLNLSENSCLDETESQFIMSWMRADRALRCLHLPDFSDSDPSDLTEALEILEGNEKIERLHLDKIMFDFDAGHVDSLVSVLQTCPSLQKLSLLHCSLSKDLIDGTLFVEAISTHPTLTELSLGHNFFGEVGCDLLKAICLRNAPFILLDLSYNRIEGALLFQTCQEIQTELKKQNRSRFPLSELDLSGNFFHLEWRNRLIETLMDCVDVFMALDPNLGKPAGSLADHISQM